MRLISGASFFTFIFLMISTPSMATEPTWEEIKKMERELTDIKLTETEEELITRILKHPKLECSVSSYGMNLIDGFF